MQSNRIDPHPHTATMAPSTMHPQDQISAERVLGIVLWIALLAVILVIQ